MDAFNNGPKSLELTTKIESQLKVERTPLGTALGPLAPFLTKRTHWIIGGDGWSFDIDAAGVDHIVG